MTPHEKLVREIVWLIGGVAFLSLLLLGVLAILERNPNDILIGALVATLGSATGALGSLLTQTGRGSSQPAPVEVVNGPDEPVFTEDVPMGRGARPDDEDTAVLRRPR